LYLTPTPIPTDSPLSNAPPEATPQLVVCTGSTKPGPCPTATPTAAVAAVAPVAPITGGGGGGSSGPSTRLIVGSVIGVVGAAALALLAMVLAGRGRHRQPQLRRAPAPAPAPAPVMMMRDDDAAADSGILSPTYTVSAPSRLFTGHHFARRRVTGADPPTAAAT
jgi:hypothetical protein